MRRRWPRVERSGPAELGARPLCAGDAFLAALADQPAFELGNAAHDGHHQSADFGGGVAPAFAKGDKAAATLGEIMEDVVEIAARAGQMAHPVGHRAAVDSMPLRAKMADCR